MPDGLDRANDNKTRDQPRRPEPDADGHLGAIESDKPGQAGPGNPNLPALDANGLPADMKKICEDVIGANVDESEG